MLQQIAQGRLRALEFIEARRPVEEAATDAAAAGQVLDGAHGRQEAEVAAIGVMLVLRQERQRGVGVGAERDGRRDRHALVLLVVDLGIAGVSDAGQPLEHLAGVVHRTAEVEGGLPEAVAARLQFDLVQRRGGGFLADQVDQAARSALAEQHG